MVLYPNPVTDGAETTLQVYLTEPGSVRAMVFTTAYRKVNEMVWSDLPVGVNPLKLPIRGSNGEALANGVYHLRVITSRGNDLAKLIVLR